MMIVCVRPPINVCDRTGERGVTWHAFGGEGEVPSFYRDFLFRGKILRACSGTIRTILYRF